MKIVLHNPKIPQNAGNVARTCSVTGNDLIMVAPLGFRTGSKYLKRAGLDYWSEVNVDITNDIDSLLENSPAPFYFFSSKAEAAYTDITFNSDDILIFGSETSGLPDHFFERWPEAFYKIPMIDTARCLNLSNAVAIVIYEAWRQQNFMVSR